MSTSFDIRDLHHRHFAHPFDHAVQYEGPTRGHDHSPDAIDGCYGIQWDEVFRDRKTGELYAVTCYDGVYRSKNARNPANEEWTQDAQERIIRRTKSEATNGGTEIRLCREEWAIMSGRIFHDWFDLLDNEQYKTVGNVNRYKREGEVGTIMGIPVVVDPMLPNPLGDPPCDVARQTAQELAKIDEYEDIAEQLGY